MHRWVSAFFMSRSFNCPSETGSRSTMRSPSFLSIGPTQQETAQPKKGKYAPGLPPEPEEGNSIDRKSSQLSTLELAFRLRRLNVRLIELSTFLSPFVRPSFLPVV
ncbi:hypothetical protein Fot_50969 [Forsythia ovata]|uniref:Uncharacterized protein n=1 Tax=Forsythia ovata TaxID=205694 RepID=A0ABD1PZP7_9LAMI